MHKKPSVGHYFQFARALPNTSELCNCLVGWERKNTWSLTNQIAQPEL